LNFFIFHSFHSIRELSRLANERLPVQLQLMHPTGHTGRVTLSSIAGVEFDNYNDEGNENSSSSSAPILNTNVNTNLSKKVNYSDGKNLINLTFDMREYHYLNNNHSSQH